MRVTSFLDVEKIFKSTSQLAAIYKWTVGHNLWTLDMNRKNGFAIKESELNISALN
jgi:hypothetical protein